MPRWTIAILSSTVPLLQYSPMSGCKGTTFFRDKRIFREKFQVLEVWSIAMSKHLSDISGDSLFQHMQSSTETIPLSIDDIYHFVNVTYPNLSFSSYRPNWIQKLLSNKQLLTQIILISQAFYILLPRFSRDWH